MAAFFTCIFTRCQFVQRLGYQCEVGDKIAIAPCEPKKGSDLGDSGRVGHFLMTCIFSPSVATPWAETMCPRLVICLWQNSPFESLRPACSSFWNTASSLTRWLAGSFKKMTISSRYITHHLRLRSLRQVSIKCRKVAEVLVSLKGILSHS